MSPLGVGLLAFFLLVCTGGSAFGRPLFPHPVAYVGDGAVGMIGTDLDDDGLDDLVVAAFQGHAVAVMFGNPDGSFAPPANYPLEFPMFPAVGDFDADGRKDLAVATYSGISIFMGNQNGAFDSEMFYETTGWPWHVAIGNFNDDDWQDIVYVGEEGLDCTVRLGNGDGTFGKAVGVGPTGDAYSVAVANFNGDGFDDLAYAVGNAVAVMLGNGDGTFNMAGSFPVGDGAYWTAAGDLDDDDIQDLVVTNEGSDDLSVLLGNGDGTFAAEQRYPVAPAESDPGPRFVAIADLDEDGLQDLAVSNYWDVPTLVLLFGVGGGQFAPAIEGGDSTRQYASAMVIDDFDGDGAEDLVRTSYTQLDINLLFGDGNGTFVTHREEDVGEGAQSVAVGDVDNDGRLDLAVANGDTSDVSVLLANGAGTFEPENRFCVVDALPPCPMTSYPVSLAIGEMTGDLHADLAVANWSGQSVSVLAGDGAGLFSLVTSLPVEGNPRSIAVGDLDGDDANDIVVVSKSSTDVTVFLGNNDGTFDAPPVLIPPSVGFDPWSVRIEDLNGDEYLDVVVASSGSDDVTVLLGAGDGSFAAAPTLVVGLDPRDVAVGDLNGDQISDLAIANSGSSDISVFLGNGDGTFVLGTVVATPDDPERVLIADLDGDGWEDLGATLSLGVAAVISGNGDGSFGPEQDHTGGIVTAGDFNLDGMLDGVTSWGDRVLVLLNQSGPSVFSFLADHVTLVWPAVTGALSYDIYRGNASALADGDDDGLPDTGYGVCMTALDDDPRDTFFVDTDIPATGSGFFYLMSVIDDQGDKGLGATSAGHPRLPQVPCP